MKLPFNKDTTPCECSSTNLRCSYINEKCYFVGLKIKYTNIFKNVNEY